MALPMAGPRCLDPLASLSKLEYLLYRFGMGVRLSLTEGLNLDPRLEVGMVTYSRREAETMSRWMREVFDQSKPMPAPAKGRRIIPTIGEEIARLLAPLL